MTIAEEPVFKLHNQARTSRGLKALCVHPDLTQAARAHSQEMLDKDYMEHNSFEVSPSSTAWSDSDTPSTVTPSIFMVRTSPATPVAPLTPSSKSG